MTKSLFIALAATLVSAPAFAQERSLDVAEFDVIDIAGSFAVEIEIGEETRVTLDGEPGDIEDIEISSEDGVLEAEQKWKFLGSNSDLDVTLHVVTPALTELEAGRGADVALTGLQAQNLALGVFTGASVEAEGECETLDVELSTGGVLDARALECRNVTVEASTGGVAELFASESLEGEANTGGEVEVFGAPSAFSADVSLGGDISLAEGGS